VHGAQYGVCYDGGPVFRDDPYRVRLASLGLREGERFSYVYNFFADWRLDLRVEQITDPQPGRVYPRCTGGRRAGPPEHWNGPWDFLQRTQPYLVYEAIVRAAEILGQLLNSKDLDEVVEVEDWREEMAGLLPLLALERFDRRASIEPLRAGSHGKDSSGMKITVSVTIQADDGTPAVVSDVVTLEREALAPGSLGLHLDEAKDILAAVQEKMAGEQVQVALSEAATCPACEAAHRHKDTRQIVVRTLFGVLRVASPRWWHCSCSAHEAATFSPLAELLPERTTPELLYLEAKFAGLVPYQTSAKLLAEVLPLGRPLHATAVRLHTQAVAQRLEDELGEEQFWRSAASRRAAAGAYHLLKVVQHQQ